ncbi:unnamed protein product, partial [Mesorhabditis spiculigera]
MNTQNGTSSTWAVSNSTNATVINDGWVRGKSALPKRGRRGANLDENGAPCFSCFFVDGCRGGMLLGNCQTVEMGYSGCCYILTFFAALALFPAVFLAGVAGMLGYKAGHDQASKR